LEDPNAPIELIDLNEEVYGEVVLFDIRVPHNKEEE